VKSIARSYFIAAAALAAIVLLYVAVYRFTGRTNNGSVYDVKYYRHNWQALLFSPAAKLESEIRDRSVVTGVEGQAVFAPGRPSDPGYMDLRR
jgi:hypothetical protein